MDNIKEKIEEIVEKLTKDETLRVQFQKDPVKAVELYRQAADAGNHMGEYRLGRCYEQGTGVRKDRHRAMELYRQASAGGCKEAGEALKRLRAGGHGHGLLGWLRGK